MQANSTTFLNIEQSLHGYDRGHRMLQCSLELDEVSRSQMLVLSDLLSTSELRHGESYVTAYPLKGAQRFVLARTWGAGANFRPGSVWTHSLIIDYQTLATVPNISILASLFHYPKVGELQQFSESLDLSLLEDISLQMGSDPRAPEALAMLYGEKPLRDIVLPSADLESNEILALQLWRQMWPGFRREFAFMTIAGEWPSGIQFACALRYTKNMGLGPPPLQDAWPVGFNALLGDLPEIGPTELRVSLARYVIENKIPRAAVMPIATLIAMRDHAPFEVRLQAYHDLIPFLQAPRLYREFIADEINKIESAAEIITLVRVLKGVVCDVDVQEPLMKFGDLSIQVLRALLDASWQSQQEELGGKVFKSVVQLTSSHMLAAAVNEQTRLKVALGRPEIADEISFWPKLESDKVNIFKQLSRIRNFDVDWGWEVFERSLSSDFLATLLIHSDSSSHGIIKFITNGTDEQRQIIVNWLFEDEQRFIDLTKKLEFPTIELLAILASAQMQVLHRIAQEEWWTTQLLNINLGRKYSNYPSSLVALGIVYALKENNQSSWNLSVKYFTLAIHAAASFNFTSIEENFLVSELSNDVPYGSTKRRIISAALSRWQISQSSLGVLALATDIDTIDLILIEIDLRGQRDTLVALSNMQQVPSITRERIEIFLSKKKRNWLLPWSWP